MSCFRAVVFNICCSGTFRKCLRCSWNPMQLGSNQLLILGGIFMKFHSMTSSCLFNRGTSFSQMVTYEVLFVAIPKMKSFQF